MDIRSRCLRRRTTVIAVEHSISFVGRQSDLEQIMTIVTSAGGVAGEIHQVSPGAEGGAFTDPALILEGIQTVATFLGSTAALVSAVNKWREWRQRKTNDDEDESSPATIVVVNNSTERRVSIECSSELRPIEAQMSDLVDS